MSETTARLESVSLSSKEGGSDKIYVLWLEQKDDKFLVQFQFGPRGGWMQGGTKTKEPVSKEDANKIYSKILKEKTAKGYCFTDAKDAPPVFTQAESKVDTGLRPMLLTSATEDDLERFITDDAWGAQEKLNGRRMLVRVRRAGGDEAR